MTTAQDRGGIPKPLRIVGLILGGTVLTSLTIGWVAFLLWLAAQIMIAIVHWL